MNFKSVHALTRKCLLTSQSGTSEVTTENKTKASTFVRYSLFTGENPRKAFKPYVLIGRRVRCPSATRRAACIPRNARGNYCKISICSIVFEIYFFQYILLSLSRCEIHSLIEQTPSDVVSSPPPSPLSKSNRCIKKIADQSPQSAKLVFSDYSRRIVDLSRAVAVGRARGREGGRSSLRARKALM